MHPRLIEQVGMCVHLLSNLIEVYVVIDDNFSYPSSLDYCQVVVSLFVDVSGLNQT